MPNPFAQNVPTTNVPAGIIKNGTFGFNTVQGGGPLNGWSADPTGGIFRPIALSLLHP
jgi:hypothetical protein